MREAETIKEIRGSRIGTIPIGTKFKVLHVVEDRYYSTCDGLPISLVYNDEYRFIDKKEKP